MTGARSSSATGIEGPRSRGRRGPHSEPGGRPALDERAISTSLSHVFGLAITSLLLVTVVVTASGYVDDQRAAVAEQQLVTIGDQLASEIHRVDALAARGGNVTTRTTVPKSVSGEDYSVALADGADCQTDVIDADDCVVLGVTSLDVTKRVPVNVSTDVALRGEGGGEFVIESTSPTGTGAADEHAPVVDRELRIGVGREFRVADGGSVASPLNRPPVAKYEFTPGIPSKNDTIRFDAAESRDPDGAITSYEWDFDGDGTTDDLGETVTRSLDPGTREVTLRVTDDEGGSSNITRTLRVSGVAYNDDLATHTGPDTVSFTITNAWDEEVTIEQILIDPEDDSISRLHGRDCGYSCSYNLSVDEDGDGSFDDERRTFDYRTFEDGGLVEELDTPIAVDAESGPHNTVGVSIGEFSEPMDGETVTIGLRYEVDGQTNSTVFTDTVGAPSIERFALERDPSDDREVNVVIESTKPLDDVEVDLGGSLSGTATETSFVDRGTTADGNHRYVNYNVNSEAPGVVKANLTHAEGTTGVESSQTAGGGTINRSTVVFESDYSWTAASDWDDATSEERVVHAAYGDRREDALELGYAATDRGGDDLVGYWTFDEGGDDASPEGNDGSLVDDPAEDAGVFGAGAYQFDGSGDYLDLSDDLRDTHGEDASLSFWIKTTRDGHADPWEAPGVTGVEEAGGEDDIFWGWIDDAGHIGIQAGDDPGPKSATEINDGTWHHVVLTYDSGDATVYVDGRKEDEGTTRDLSGVAAPFSGIGRIDDTGGSHVYLDGSLDEVRAYDRVLTDDEAQRLYNTSRNGTLTTDWQRDDVIAPGDLALDYDAELPSGTGINVTVYSDTDGDGVADEESDVIELSDGGTREAVTGLSSASDAYRLEIELESDSPLKTPTLRGAALTDTS